jgi:hypothetical protein
MTAPRPGDGDPDDGPRELGRRVDAVLERWDRRLVAATVAWQRLPPAEQRTCEAELDERGESEEWLLALWSWWIRSSIEERDLLVDDIRLLAPALRIAARDGVLDGPGEKASAARHLREGTERMERILGLAP